MSEPTPPAPRPVSGFAIFAFFVLFSAFGLLAEKLYFPHRPAEPQNEAPEHLPKDMAWRATHASRRAYLVDLKQKQAEQAATYGWVDKDKKIVQLPIGRAMTLIVQENGGSR